MPGFSQAPSHAPSRSDTTLRLVPDLDSLEALSPEREALRASLEKTSFLTADEKRAAIGYGPMSPAEPQASKFNPYHDALGRFTFGPDGGDGSLLHQIAKRPPKTPDKKPPGPGHNNPPGPIPVPPIIPPPSQDDRPRLLDEHDQAAPRRFDRIDDLNAFKERLSEALTGDVSAVMQGSAVEQGGARFRNSGPDSSDFDISLAGTNLHARAAELFPGWVKADRIGPLNFEQMRALGIDVSKIAPPQGRDTKFMIYPSQIALYHRGPGYRAGSTISDGRVGGSSA